MKLIFMLSLFLSMPSLVAAESVPAVAKVTEQAIYPIVVRGEKNSYNATAFFIGPTKIVTAAHTFKKAKSENTFILKDGQKIPCTVLSIDTKVDCAILECSQPNATFLTLYDPVFHNSGWVENDSTRSFETDQSDGIQSLDNKVRTNNTCKPGMSGCPMQDDQGRVVGMCVATDWLDKQTCFFVPARLIIKMVGK